MLGIFRKQRAAEPPLRKTKGQRVVEALAKVQETEARYVAAEGAIRAFVDKHNLVLADMGPVPSFPGNLFTWTPEAHAEWKTLNATRDAAEREFHQALANHANALSAEE